jgi:hypothetical protein
LRRLKLLRRDGEAAASGHYSGTLGAGEGFRLGNLAAVRASISRQSNKR